MASSKKGPLIGAIVVIVLVAVPGGVWLARDAIATSMARDRLTEAGLSCDERFEVSVSAGLGEAVVGPTRCTREGGIVEAVELLGDVAVTLEGTEPTAVEAESVRVTLRDADVRGGSGWASPLRRLSLEQRVARLIKGLSELSALPLPPTTVARVEVVRRSAPVARGLGLSVTPDAAGVALAARELVFPATIGRLQLTGVSGRAAAGAVDLEGQALAEAGIGILAVSRGGPFELAATGLDTASPRFALTGDF